MRSRLILSAISALLGATLAVSAGSKTHAAPAKPAVRSQVRKPAAPAGVSRDPYLGAIVVDAANGRVLFNDNADAAGYPASVVKLMDLLIVLERVQQGTVKFTDMVTITAESARIGGSQVYLKERETFTVDDLLYALMVQSANDAASALAIHVAGSHQAFVDLMNRKAQELGMVSTHFHSVHGLPPAIGQEHDVSTPRDLALLGRAVLKYPEALRYTSTKERTFRFGTFTLRNHNPLLASVDGCDGLKTGWFPAAGYSIVATAQRGRARAIAVVLGSRYRQTRNLKASELLSQGLQSIPPPTPEPPPVLTNAAPTNVVIAPAVPPVHHGPGWVRITLIVTGGLVGLILVVVLILTVVGRKKEF